MKSCIDNTELEKASLHFTIETFDYLSRMVMGKKIDKKLTGNITTSYLDVDEALAEKTFLPHINVQLIHGKAELNSTGKNT